MGIGRLGLSTQGIIVHEMNGIKFTDEYFLTNFSYALAYTSEDTYCPHDTGETWYYWDSYDYDWEDADAGLGVRCVSSSSPGKSIQSLLALLGSCYLNVWEKP